MTLELIAGLVLSGLAGVAATICYQHWSEGRRWRLSCFRELFRHGPNQSGFMVALNEIPAAFHNRPIVMRAHQRFLDSMYKNSTIHVDELPALIRAIAQDLRIRDLSDLQLMHRFGTEPLPFKN